MKSALHRQIKHITQYLFTYLLFPPFLTHITQYVSSVSESSSTILIQSSNIDTVLAIISTFHCHLEFCYIYTADIPSLSSLDDKKTVPNTRTTGNRTSSDLLSTGVRSCPAMNSARLHSIAMRESATHVGIELL